MKLNLGCGPQVPEGWINVDYAFGARLATKPLFRALNKRLKFFAVDWHDSIFIHNLTERFPWSDGAVHTIYSSHTLEHLSREEGLFFLRESHRVLKTGGIIRIVVPDLAAFVNKYLSGELRANDFVERLGVLYEKKSSTLKTRLGSFIQFPHKCMYDTQTLLAILEEIGFKASSRKPFNSNIQDIQNVELEIRTVDAVIVEGKKE